MELSEEQPKNPLTSQSGGNLFALQHRVLAQPGLTKPAGTYTCTIRMVSVAHDARRPTSKRKSVRIRG
jgi:hypothetical protein